MWSKIKPEVETEKICINCGFKNDATAKFCGNCGNDLSLEKNTRNCFFRKSNTRKISYRPKGFTHKVLSDVKNEAKSKKELENAIEDYTLDIPDIRKLQIA